MSTPRLVRCVLLGAALAAALGIGQSARAQRGRSSGKQPAAPVPGVEITMPTADSAEDAAASDGHAAPPWLRPMNVPGVSASPRADGSPGETPQTGIPKTAAAPSGPTIQIDLPDPADKGRTKADRSKVEKSKADKTRTEKTKKPSPASRLAKSHATGDAAAQSIGLAASGVTSSGSAAAHKADPTAHASPSKKTWRSAGASRRGPDETESGSLRERVRRARSDSRDRTASLPPQSSANLR